MSGSRLADSKTPEARNDLRIWRGQAAHAWGAGVDGIYTFNRFDPHDPVFQELGDPRKLETLESTYRFIAGSQAGTWLKNGERFYNQP